VVFFCQLGAAVTRIGLEAGPLSQWLHARLTAAGFEAVLLETRHVKAALSAMVVETDRKDARGIAQLLRMGWYRPVHRKSPDAQEVRALLVGRKLLQAKLRDDLRRPTMEASIADVICHAIRHAAVVLPVAAIATYTTSGSTTLRAARERPLAPILGLTPDVRVARRLCLAWGTYAVRIEVATRVAEIVEHACEAVSSEGLAGPGDIIAIAAGQPFGVAGSTNLLRIEKVTET
jgi:hypothetical protein